MGYGRRRTNVISQTDYVNVSEVPNKRLLLLGTDNFGRDVLTELVSATGVSLVIGFVAGLVATTIGLIFGLVSGYIGGLVDEVIVFITNLFTVIPAFVLLILISFSIGQRAARRFHHRRGHRADVLVWTARAAVRAGHFTPGPRSRQPVQTIRTLDLPHSADRHSALYRFLCRHCADPIDVVRDPG